MPDGESNGNRDTSEVSNDNPSAGLVGKPMLAENIGESAGMGSFQACTDVNAESFRHDKSPGCVSPRGSD